MEQKMPPQTKTPAVPVRMMTVAQSPSVTTLNADIRHKLSGPSGISKGTTTPLGKKSKMLVPPQPKTAKSGEEFVCDYCCLVLQSNIALSTSWAYVHLHQPLLDPILHSSYVECLTQRQRSCPERFASIRLCRRRMRRTDPNILL